MSGFDLFIGVDYSGAETPGSRLPGLQVYAARPGAAAPERWSSPTPSNNRQRVNWTRREIAERLRGEISGGACLLAGIDHGFSFPVSYFARYGLKTWPDFLADFTKYWPTHLDHVYVDFVRDGSLHRHGRGPRPGQRVGSADEFRLTERWTSSAKSVFQLDGQGTVGKSTHAGIPWLRWLREELGDRNRYPREGRSADEHDAYATARWMAEMSARGALDSYFAPPLTLAERAIASLEGWILGVR